MEAFETTLTGSDGDIAGIVTQLSKEAYQFTSFDDALHLTIAKDEHGKWTRLSGSEPYFSGWVDELIEKVAAEAKSIKPASNVKTPLVPTEKSIKATPAKTATVKKATPTKKATSTASVTKKKAVAPSLKAKTTNTDKKTTVAASASKKAKVSSAVAKGK